MATIAQIISRIDEKIYSIIDDPDSIASYRMGDKTVSKSQILDQLRQLRVEYQTRAETEPYEDIRHIAFDLDRFGVEESEYIGDDLLS